MRMEPVSHELARPSTFWIGAAAVLAAAAWTCREPAFSDLLGFLLITGAALLPAALWCWRRVKGLPIYPLFAIGTVGTFALPLIANHPLVIDYPARERFTAAVTVAGTTLAGTAAWYLSCRACVRAAASNCLVLRPGVGSLAFAAILVGTVSFNLAQMPLMNRLDPSVYSLLRGVVIALSNVAIFILAYRWGRPGLSSIDRAVHAALIAATMISTLPSALMVGALAYGLMALIGYALGRGRVPWLSLAALGAAALFLQGGKEDLRKQVLVLGRGGADHAGGLSRNAGRLGRIFRRPLGRTALARAGAR